MSGAASELLPFRCLRAIEEIVALQKHARTDAVDLVERIHAITEEALRSQSNKVSKP